MKWDVDWLAERSRLFPDKVGIVDAETETEWTYEQLYHRSLFVEEKLKKAGIKSGDRVALLGPNHISYIDYMFAVRRIGAIFVPLNWRLSEEELAYIMLDCAPELLVYHEDFSAMARVLNVPSKYCINESATQVVLNPSGNEGIVSMDETWMIIYTGGTTGKPKGVVLTNRSVYTNAVNTILSWKLTSEDVTLTMLPMFHTGGINALTLPVLLAGGTVILSSFTPDKAISLLCDYNCTVVLMVPTMYHSLIQDDLFKQQSFPSIKVFLSGGAPCPRSVYTFFERRSIPFKEGYGLTEAGPNNFFITPERALLKPGSVGRPMIYNKIKLVDTNFQTVLQGEAGELAIYGEHVFKQYWKNDTETVNTLKDGWLLTGDLAREDEDGDFYILGRKKDMVITGGENVYPQEVEQVIREHPAVKDIAVIGLPDVKWGEMVTAVIVLEFDTSVTKDELEKFCSKKLARYKVPKQIYFRNELPVTHVGKINKKELISNYNAVQG